MEFQYVGDGNEPPLRTTVFGYEFELGGAVDVQDEDAIAKLKNMHIFKHEFADSGELATLRADLESAGVKVDGRWGEERLRLELANATNG